MSSTTLVDQIDNHKLYADRAEKDKNGYDIATTYANKANLSKVATTGMYNDLIGLPSVQPQLTSSDSIDVPYAGSSTCHVRLPMVTSTGSVAESGLTIDSGTFAAWDGAHAVYSSGGSDYNVIQFDGVTIVGWNTPVLDIDSIDTYLNVVKVYFVQGTTDSVGNNVAQIGIECGLYGSSSLEVVCSPNGTITNLIGTLDMTQPFMAVIIDTDIDVSQFSVTNFLENSALTEYSYGRIHQNDTWVVSPGLRVNVPQVKTMMNLATVASSGSYNDLSNKPTIPTVPTAGNMLSTTNNVLNVTTTAGITDIQLVQSMPASPSATVLYLIPEN